MSNWKRIGVYRSQCGQLALTYGRDDLVVGLFLTKGVWYMQMTSKRPHTGEELLQAKRCLLPHVLLLGVLRQGESDPIGNVQRTSDAWITELVQPRREFGHRSLAAPAEFWRDC